MKYKTLIPTIVLFIASAWNASAGELSLSLSQRSLDNADDVFSVDKWDAMQLSYSPDNSDMYYFISKESFDVSPIYTAWTYNMVGLGVGTRAKLTQRIRLFGQIGVYKVKNSWGGRHRRFNEGLYYYLNRRFYGSQTTFYSPPDGPPYYEFKDYSVKNKKYTIGGTIGLELLQPISDNITAGFSISKRIIKIHEEINAYAYDGESGNWAHTPNRDYTSTSYGLSLNYAF